MDLLIEAAMYTRNFLSKSIGLFAAAAVFGFVLSCNREGSFSSRQGAFGENPNLKISVEADGQPATAKIIIKGLEGTADPVLPSLSPDVPAGPETIESRNVAFTRNGYSALVLNPGKYELWISKGPEYSVESRVLTVVATAFLEERVAIRRIIDTSGYLSADFHQHSGRSGDSVIPLLSKVLSNVAEDVKILVATDHNRLTDYAAEARAVLPEKLMTIIGTEYSTPTDLHANAFPLRRDAQLPDINISSTEVFAGLRAAGDGENFIQVNHPHAKSNPFPIEQKWDEDFDAMEVFNAFELSYYPDASVEKNLETWYAVLKKGRMIVGTGVSDSHMLSRQEVGYPRTYVHFDNPSQATPADLVYQLKNTRNVIVSNGPFIRFVAAAGGGPDHPIGSVVKLAFPQKVKVKFKVESQPWMRLNAAEVIVNGISVKKYALTHSPSDVVKLPWTEVEVDIEQDSFVLVIVKGEGSLFPFTEKKNSYPLAFTNPIYFRAP